MRMQKILCIILSYFSIASAGNESLGRSLFLRDFINNGSRPTTIVSYMKLGTYDTFKFYCGIREVDTFIAVTDRMHYATAESNHVLYLLDLRQDDAVHILQTACRNKQLIVPARWILFYKRDATAPKLTPENNTFNIADGDHELAYEKARIEILVADVNIGVNTEVYVTIESIEDMQVFLIYKIRQNLPLRWESYGSWSPTVRFTHPPPTTAALAMRRKNLHGHDMVVTAVFFNNESLIHAKEYLHLEEDILSKVVYFMAIHLFEWMNATGHFNTSDSWGYQQPDGTYSNGIVKELYDSRSDFSGTVLIPMKNRLPAVEYVLPPAPINVVFLFRRPSLASVANIYMLPFSQAVWFAILALILVSSFTLFVTSFSEIKVNNQYQHMSKFQLMSDGFHDTLCMVFQQGTANEPVSVSSRQILLLGLMAFMFLYTAYSANVVALLQSATNDINSVETLLSSPLQIGAEDVVYNREIFLKETRPVHRALWLKKGAPQGDKFFMSIQEGIRRMREGMFAFHTEPTAGYLQVKKTFLEHEKCNLGSVKYTEFLYPYIGLARNSHVKEPLRIGVVRIIEAGVQARTRRRVVVEPPACAAAAIFTAVSLLDVAPAFKCLAVVYALAITLLAIEIFVYRREKRKNMMTEIENEAKYVPNTCAAENSFHN